MKKRLLLVIFLTTLCSIAPCIKVFAQLKISMGATGNSGCIYTTAQFVISNPPPSFQTAIWDFGDGQTGPSLNANTQHYYSTAGKFIVTAIIQTPNGPVSAKSDTVYIHNRPTAQIYTTNGNKFCNPATVCFVDSSRTAIPLPGRLQAPIVNTFTFPGDGGFISALHTPPFSRNFCYTYPSPDYNTYTITLKIKDSNGCADSIVKKDYVYVSGNLGAKFSVNAPLGCSKIPARFYTDAVFVNLTRSEVVYPDSVRKFRWDFGDGLFDTTNWYTVTHRYSGNGKFTPRLFIESMMGCRDTFVYLPGVKNTSFAFNVQPSAKQICTTPGAVCWSQPSVSGATMQWSFYVNPNPAFNVNTGDYIYGTWKPLSPDPKIFNEASSFTPCRTLPCGLARTSLRITAPGCRDTLWSWDTVEVTGPDAVIEIYGSNSTAIADSMRRQCRVENKVHFPNNSCHYKAFHVQRLWDFGDPYASRCTTDTKRGINVTGHDTLSKLDPIKYPPGINRSCNCNFSADSMPSHTYTDWDTLALRSVNGKTFIAANQPPYTTKNYPAYTVKLMLYDSVNKCGDTDQVQLSFGLPKSGPADALVSAGKRVIMPGVTYNDPVMLKRTGLTCLGSSPNGIVFDLSGLYPSQTRSFVAMNFDSLAGNGPTNWVTQPNFFSSLNNQNPWPTSSGPRIWPNTIAKNYFDPPGIADSNGYVTIGIITATGYGNKICLDTSWYHNFFRFTPLDARWGITNKDGNGQPITHGLVPFVVKGSLTDNYQDSIAVITWAWHDGWLTIDSIQRPGSKPGITTYQRMRYVTNPAAQIVSQTNLSGMADTVVGVDTIAHTYTESGRFYPSVTLTNTAGCHEFSFKEIIAGFGNSFTASDQVICINDSIQLRDSVFYWIYPEPIFPPKEVHLFGRDPYLGGWRKALPVPPFQLETLKWRVLKRNPTNGQFTLISQLNGPLPKYAFGNSGLYRIELIATDSTGSSDTTWQWITVVEPKAGIYSVTKNFGCSDTVRLSDNSTIIDPYFQAFGTRTDSILSENQNGYYWDFGDGKTPSPLKNVVHDYTSNGTFTIYHRIRTANQCLAVIYDTIRIDGPTPEFKILGASSGNAPFSVTLQNLSNSTNNKSKSFIWYFGNPQDPFNSFSTNSDSNITKVYNQAGVFCITLLAKDQVLAQPNLCPVRIYPDTNSPNGVPICVTVTPNPLGVPTIAGLHSKSLWLYPNPAKELLTIRSAEEMQTDHILVIDMLGRQYPKLQWEQNGNKEVQLNVQSLPAGTYVIELHNMDSIHRIRFIRN